MSKNNDFSRSMAAAVLAFLFAVSAAVTAGTAMGAAVSVPAACLAAALSATLCALGARSTRLRVVSALLLAAIAAAYALTHRWVPGAVRALALSWRGDEADASLAARGGGALCVALSFALGLAFYAMLSRREFIPLGTLILLSVLVCAHAMSATASIAATLPGLMAAAAAFAMTGAPESGGRALWVLIPSALAVALALLLSPAGRVTWQPLEDAAARVRSAFEQYFNFTRERIAFSINEEGYDHVGEVEDQATAMLGGPAQPHTNPVMRMTAPTEVLLRGAIRGTYTGYSWVDPAPKNRYLYFDVTHRGVRNKVFDLDFKSPEGAFASVEVSVEMLDEGTSTLFVPARTERFTMDLANAVYYNTSGEMFMARQAQAGDAYSLTARLPANRELLRQAAQEGQSARDDRYDDYLAAYTALPVGVEPGLYALTQQLTEGLDAPIDRAIAIEEYLRRNMRYDLNVDYPPQGRDFVSWFVLESREGYCSYYASAMAVMGRIAGLPTRYVEGYLARPGASGTVTLTGQDAHAWAEVYFKGLGWIAFDATGGATGSHPEGGLDSLAAQNPGREPDAGLDENALADPPTPEPTLPPEDEAPQESPTPDPGEGDEAATEPPEDAPSETPTPPPYDDPSDAPPETPPDTPQKPRLWPVLLALAILVLILVAAVWLARRLAASNPARLCASADPERAAMIAYRANLTALARMGQAPASGETPEAFAQRVAAQLNCPEYAEFVRAVTASRYGRQPLRKQDAAAGLRAYRAFTRAMSRRERLRLALTRITRGLGDFDAIP